MVSEPVFNFVRMLLNEVELDDAPFLLEKMTVRLNPIERTITLEWWDADDTDFHDLQRLMAANPVHDQ